MCIRDSDFFVAKQRTAGYECLPGAWQQYWSVSHEAWYFVDGHSGTVTWQVPAGARLVQEKPLLLVLAVDDFRYCGLSASDKEEARLAAVIGSVASNFLVPGFFPKMPDYYWADDWHFTEQGAEIFADHLAKSLRHFLVGLGRYREGMSVLAVSDSTFDFLNWDKEWRWVGKGDAIFKRFFFLYGFTLSVDVAGTTGFCVSTKSAGCFPARLRERR